MNIQLAIAIALAGGCAAEPAPGGELPLTLEEHLAGGMTLDVEVDSWFDVGASNASGDPLAIDMPVVTGGQIALRVSADGLLMLDAVDIALSDFAIEKPTGGSNIRLELADTRLQLAEQTVVDAAWDPDGRRMRGVARGDLLLDWALVDDDGDVHPLATQTIRGIELAVNAQLFDDGADGSRILVTVDTFVGGRIWDFGDIEVHDLQLNLAGQWTDAPLL